MTSETIDSAELSSAPADHPVNAARNSLVINLLLASAFVVFTNLVVDILYAVLDPRVHL